MVSHYDHGLRTRLKKNYSDEPTPEPTTSTHGQCYSAMQIWGLQPATTGENEEYKR